MKKKIAVLVRERQGEALRMSVGLTFENDEVHVFIMDMKLEETDAMVLSIDALRELGVRIYSNNRENSFDFMSTEDIARSLVNYDTVIPY